MLVQRTLTVTLDRADPRYDEMRSWLLPRSVHQYTWNNGCIAVVPAEAGEEFCRLFHVEAL
jgi:hypothetical protein